MAKGSYVAVSGGYGRQCWDGRLSLMRTQMTPLILTIRITKATRRAKQIRSCAMNCNASIIAVCSVSILSRYSIGMLSIAPCCGWLLLRYASHAGRGGRFERLAVHRVLDPANHHFVVGRLAEAHLLLRIGVVFILRRVVEVTSHYESGPLRNRDGLLEVVGGLPRQGVPGHVEQHLRAAVGIEDLDLHRLAAVVHMRRRADEMDVLRRRPASGHPVVLRARRNQEVIVGNHARDQLLPRRLLCEDQADHRAILL